MHRWQMTTELAQRLGVTDTKQEARLAKLVRLAGEEHTLRWLAESSAVPLEASAVGAPGEAFILQAEAELGPVVLSYPWYMDQFWLAIDACDELAVFYSAGWGPIPLTILERLEQDQAAINYFWALPPRSDVLPVLEPPIAGDTLRLAQAGLHVYDWADVTRTHDLSGQYECEARPQRPLVLADVNPVHHALLTNVRFSQVRFRDHVRLDVGAQAACVPRLL